MTAPVSLSRFLVLFAAALGLGACQSSGLTAVSTSVCASGQQWQAGTDGSSEMKPGNSCIQCHASEGEGPTFIVAGTVYAGQHESDDCGGVSGVVIDILDKDGKVTLSTTSNGAGNFYLKQGTLPKPYTARVTYKGASRLMDTPQYSGDCAACHTKTGTSDAPGRVAIP